MHFLGKTLLVFALLHSAFQGSIWMQSQKRQNDLCSFPRQTIPYHGDPSLSPTSNAEEAEVEWFYEDLQDLLELPPKKDVLFFIEDWNAKLEIKKHL